MNVNPASRYSGRGEGASTYDFFFHLSILVLHLCVMKRFLKKIDSELSIKNAIFYVSLHKFLLKKLKSNS